MTEVGVTALLRGLLILVNHDVQIAREHCGDLAKSLKVELAVADKPRQADGSQIADRGLIGSRVLDDLRTQITRLDRTQVLLIRLRVGCVLLEKLRTPRLDLRVQDHLPNLLCRHRLASTTLLLLLGVEILEDLSMAIRKTRSLIRREERPLTVVLHALHEEIRNPHAVKEITRALLFGTLVELHTKKVLDIAMPGLQIDRKGARPLASLVDLTSRVVEHTEHRHDSSRLAIGALNLGILATDVVNAESDATRPLRDLGAIPKGLVDTLNTVVIHLHKKAGRELRVFGPRIEERGGCMNEESE